MKKLLLLFIVIVSFESVAQDSTSTQTNKKIYNEIGVNATQLIKQIFSLSNNTVTTLPYSLTYNLICGKLTYRAGLGISITNSNTNSTTTITSSQSTQNNNNTTSPNYNNASSFFYRAGIAYRFRVNRRIIAYAGLDLVGQNVTSKSSTTQEFNNLPSSDQITKTTDNLTSSAFGGGPVAGIQFYITKRFSIFTEMPMYMLVGKQTESTDSYQQITQQFGSNSTSDNLQVQTTKTTNVSFVLPVTIYMAIKF